MNLNTIDIQGMAIELGVYPFELQLRIGDMSIFSERLNVEDLTIEELCLLHATDEDSNHSPVRNVLIKKIQREILVKTRSLKRAFELFDMLPYCDCARRKPMKYKCLELLRIEIDRATTFEALKTLDAIAKSYSRKFERHNDEIDAESKMRELIEERLDQASTPAQIIDLYRSTECISEIGCVICMRVKILQKLAIFFQKEEGTA